MRLLRPLFEVAVVLVVALGLARWALGLFSRKTTVYRPTVARQLALLTWPGLAVAAGLVAALAQVLAAARQVDPARLHADAAARCGAAAVGAAFGRLYRQVRPPAT